jgi:hypothetical protein
MWRNCGKLRDPISGAAFRFRPGDIMTNSSLTIVVAAAPGLAKSPKLVRYTAPLPEVVVRPSIVLHTVGRNGYWVTATWSCWVDDGQERIHDCGMQDFSGTHRKSR